MGKRSNFTRIARDYYATPKAAVEPLLWVVGGPLPFVQDYAEPCAGDGALTRAIAELTDGLGCVYAADIEPRGPEIEQRDFLLTKKLPGRFIITNPPWGWSSLEPILDKCFELGKPAWLLLPADFMHNKRSYPYMRRCERIISVGRVKWIADSPFTGKDNAAWYLFAPYDVAATVFIARRDA